MAIQILGSKLSTVKYFYTLRIYIKSIEVSYSELETECWLAADRFLIATDKWRSIVRPCCIGFFCTIGSKNITS